MSSIPMLKSASDARREASGLFKVFAPLRERFEPRWLALAARERIGILLAFTAIGILSFWMIGIAPALKTLRTVPAQRADLEAQRQVMQRLATEAQTLRQQAPIAPGQAEMALRGTTEQLGSAARLSTTGDRTTVTLTGVEGAALVTWLSEARTAARARIVEAQLTRNEKGYAGTIVLSLPHP